MYVYIIAVLDKIKPFHSSFLQELEDFFGLFNGFWQVENRASIYKMKWTTPVLSMLHNNFSPTIIPQYIMRSTISRTERNEIISLHASEGAGKIVVGITISLWTRSLE